MITHKLWRILRYNKLFSKVGLKLHNKALSKTFCLDTVNFVYSHSDENVNMLITMDTKKSQISPRN